jgi:hypothetical protein
MKIAVVGGGIFGITAAWFLAKDNFSVDLYEKEDDIFKAASGINQYRLHRGYHYPRSKETILTCLHGEKEFKEVYPEAVLDEGIEHYYSVAKEGSFLTPKQFKKIWDECGLEYEEVDLDITNSETIATDFKVKEFLFDHEKLKEICWDKLKEYKVNVLLNTKAEYESIKDKYDLVVVATYAHNNTLLESFPSAQKDYQFEFCEKLALKLPEKFKNKSVVVMDGPFMCIDPVGKTGLHAMGNVVHAIHSRTVGKRVELFGEYANLLNKGIIKSPPLTNIKNFLEHASEYFPGIEESEHVGSMYTIRTVLPHHDHDDARPTIVEQISDNIITLFSGKIPTCVDAANQVLQIANRKRNRGTPK